MSDETHPPQETMLQALERLKNETSPESLHMGDEYFYWSTLKGIHEDLKTLADMETRRSAEED